jgi:hypothetical protein
MNLDFDDMTAKSKTVWLIDYESGGNRQQRFKLNSDSTISPSNLPHMVLDVGSDGRLRLNDKKYVSRPTVTYTMCDQPEEPDKAVPKTKITFKGKQISSMLV